MVSVIEVSLDSGVDNISKASSSSSQVCLLLVII